MKNLKSKVWFAVVCAVVVGLVALGVRLYAVTRLPIDDDETTYLMASLRYTNYLRQGQYKWLAWDKTNYEHPPLTKILYGAALLTQPKLDSLHQSDLIDNQPVMESQGVLYALEDRRVAAVISSIAVFILALFNPLAGLIMGINTLCVKYTSEVYLEAIPLLSSVIAVIAYSQYYRRATQPHPDKKKEILWLLLSTLGLGLTAATKYVYCVAGIAIVVHWVIAILRKKLPVRHLGYIAIWGLLALGAFFVLDPYLWPHPIQRFIQSVTYHVRFSNSTHVKDSGYPFWQPLLWLFNPFVDYKVGSNSAFLLHLDPILFMLAVIGLPRLFKRSPIFFSWLAVGLLFLLVWSTKWAQYPLIIMAPYSLSAAYGLTTLYDDFIRGKLLRSKTKPATARSSHGSSRK